MFSIGKRVLMALVLAGSFVGTAVPAHAEWRDDCRRQIHDAEWRLRRAELRHGSGSPQAERRRYELERVRDRCRGRRRHWDHDRDRDRY